ncbi:MAG: hypothetical protein H0V74_09420 [Chloroflexi bacterium]|nr:hypothetical protein [Chloroflexota bacterium]
MPSDVHAPRSRRALPAAAAGSAAALATAALPLTAAAADDPNDVVKGIDNPTITTTSITDSATDSTAFAGIATGSGSGYGLLGTSAGGGGVVGWSVSPPDPSWFLPAYTGYTGVFGSAPSHPDPAIAATGVWGDSPDIGVFGSGASGVVGFGFVGVEGDANSNPGSVGVWAWAPLLD